MYRWIFRLFPCVGTSLEKCFEFVESLDMPSMNRTQHRTSFLVSCKEVHLIRGKCHISTSSGEKKSTKSGQSKLRKKNNALRLYPGQSFMETVFSICNMCRKFPSFVLWKKRCKQNVQIKIPDERLQKTSTFFWRPLRL